MDRKVIEKHLIQVFFSSSQFINEASIGSLDNILEHLDLLSIKSRVFAIKCSSDVIKWHSNNDRVYLFWVSKHLVAYLLLDSKINIEDLNHFEEELNNFILVARQNPISEQLYIYESIIEELPFDFAYKDTDMIYKAVSNVTNKQFSDSFESIVGKSFRDIYPVDQIPIVSELDNYAIINQKPYSKEILFKSNNSTRIIDSRRIPIFNQSQDKLIGLISMGFDITEEKKNKSKLDFMITLKDALVKISSLFVNENQFSFDQTIQESLKILGEASNADRAYIFTYDFILDTTSNTHEWCKESITPQIQELQQIPLEDLYDEWVSLHKSNHYVSINNVDELSKDSYLFTLLDSQDIKSLITLPIYINDQLYGFVGLDAVKEVQKWDNFIEMFSIYPKLFAGYKINIDYKTAIEKALSLAEEANKIKTDFLNLMSHEIKTPLNGISSSLYLLNQTNLSTDQLLLLDMAEQSNHSLSRLVENILDYSRFQTEHVIKKEIPFYLEEEMFETFRTFQIQAYKKGLEYRIKYDYSLPEILIGDIEKIKRVISNLISNAIKYTDKGKVIFEVSIKDKVSQTATLIFNVTDTGPGVSKKDQDNLFNKFFQSYETSNKHITGSGLGLTIASEMVKLLRGTISIRSEIGNGSNFQIELPLTIKKDRDILIKDHKYKCLLISNQEDMTNIHKLFSIVNCNLTTMALKEVQTKIDCNKYNYIFIHFQTNRELRKNIHLLDILENCDSYTIALHNFLKIDYTTEIKNKVDELVSLPIESKKLENLIQTIQKKYKNEICERNQVNDSYLHALVVDDNRLNRELLGMILERAGVYCWYASDGYKSIEICEKMKFDVIFMDIRMPNLDGYQTSLGIKNTSLNCTTPIYAVTANASPYEETNIVKYNLEGLLKKPINHQVISTILQDLKIKKDYSIIKTIKIPDYLEVFDYDQFSSMYSINTQIEIINLFNDEFNNWTIKIREATKTKENEILLNQLQNIKGTFIYITANRLNFLISQAINILQSSLKLDDTFFNLFSHEYNQLKKQLNSLPLVKKT